MTYTSLREPTLQFPVAAVINEAPVTNVSFEIVVTLRDTWFRIAVFELTVSVCTVVTVLVPWLWIAAQGVFVVMFFRTVRV